MDGNNQYVTIGNKASLNFDHNNSFTIEAWVKTSASSQRSIFSKMLSSGSLRGYDFLIQNGKLQLYLISTWSSNVIHVVGNDLVNDGNWHHVAVSYNGSGISTGVKFYVDGLLQTNNVLTSGSISGGLTNSASAEIGMRWGNFDFIGQLDEIRIWNDELTQADLRTWMTRKLNQNHPKLINLVSYYRFDESSGTTLIDLTENNNGTLSPNFNPAADWVLSGAALGDTSVNSYANANISLNNASLTNISAGNGIHLYYVSDTANATTPPANTSNVDFAGYYGVFAPGGNSYNINYDGSFIVASNQARVINRDNNSDNTWAVASGFSSSSSTGQINHPSANSQEFTFGQTTSSAYPTPPGSGYALEFDGADDFVSVNRESLTCCANAREIYLSNLRSSPCNNCFSRKFYSDFLLSICKSHL